jgi:hypothetical protein
MTVSLVSLFTNVSVFLSLKADNLQQLTRVENIVWVMFGSMTLVVNVYVIAGFLLT